MKVGFVHKAVVLVQRRVEGAEVLRMWTRRLAPPEVLL